MSDPKLHGYGRMLNTCRNSELNIHLAAWLCCAADSPVVDYFLCQHCENYLAMNKDEKKRVPGWEGAVMGRSIDSNRLNEAFLGLMPDQRMVIYLKIVKGFSNHEVAEVLSRSVGTVKAIQTRGLMNMLHLLFPEREFVSV